MSLITKVKAGSVSSLSDARYFSGMGVDWLGFDLNTTSPHYVSPTLYQSIVGWVNGPKRVIELAPTATADSIPNLLESYRPDFIEVEIHQLQLIKSLTELPIILRVDLNSAFASAITKGAVDFILVQSNNALTQRQRLEQLSQLAPILLAVQAATQNMKELLIDLPISGISLQGSLETKVGEKEYPFAELLESLEED